MPTFEFQTPEGRTYEFDAPDQTAALNAFNSVYKPPPMTAARAVEGAFEPIRRIPEIAAEHWRRGLEEAELARPVDVKATPEQRQQAAQQPPPYYDPQHPYLSALRHALPSPTRALGALEALTAWPSAATESIVERPSGEMTTGGLQAAGVPKEIAESIGQVGGGTLGLGAGLVYPEIAIPGRAPRMPVQPQRLLGTRLTAGEATQDPVLLDFERKARAGHLGEPAQRAALAHDVERAPEITAATATMRERLDPLGGVARGDANEAARILQASVQRRAARTRAGVDVLYRQARRGGAQDGAIDTIAFNGMGRGIRDEASLGTDPVQIDSAVTPNAARMVDDLDQQPRELLRRLRIRVPEGTEVAGLDLAMVDQIRKRLSGWRNAAFSHSREDARAAVRVLQRFDERIDAAIDTGLFRTPDGAQADPEILQAWKDARAAHADYKAAFQRQGREDAVGRAMEKIIGRYGRPAEIPDKVAAHIWGSSNLAPSTANVELTRRLLGFYGPDSVERGLIREGLFSRVIGEMPGAEPLPHNIVAMRLNKFLNTEMAKVAYEPWQQDLLRSYADLRQRLHQTPVQVPQVSAHGDWLARLLGGRVGNVIGHGLGHMTGVPFAGPVLRYGGEKLVQRAQLLRDARRIEHQMPAIGKAWDDYVRATERYQQKRTARNIARVSLAARNLDHNLRAIGSSLTEVTQQQQPAEPTPARQQMQQRLGITVP